MPARTIRRRPCNLTADFALHLSPVLRRIYASRGLQNTGELNLTLDQLLPVRSLEGVEEASTLLLHHYSHGSGILVVGDFDADGATSCALMVRCLRRLQFPHVGFLVPNRFRYGYGLTPEIVALAAERRPSLIVTVDNGISSHAGIAEAKLHNIEVLVTDHHLPGAQLPDAAVVVNPNLSGSQFGSRALAGVGVAFYVMAALVRRMQQAGYSHAGAVNVAEYLDLVALGTVADLVPLDRNNRVLVAQGMRRIRAGRCVPGIAALLEQGNRRPEWLVAQDLGFAVAPRLNAAGRIDDMTIGVECLLTDDIGSARRLAARLSELNAERREIEQRMQEDALTAVQRVRVEGGGHLNHAVCLYDASWHQGVVGLVASRVKDRVHRPVIALARAEEAPSGESWLRGSARSVPGVHIRDVLEAISTRYPGLIEKFGGHAMAAGLTIRESALQVFESAFVQETARWLDVSAQGVIESDGELLPEEMTLTTALQLREAGPWGQGFPEPAFDGEFTVVDARVVGERHLKLRVATQRSDEPYEAILFRYFDEPSGNSSAPGGNLPGGRVQLAYRLDVNEYLGSRRLQLVVEHIACGPEAAATAEQTVLPSLALNQSRS